jgi:hypothetical protein
MPSKQAAIFIAAGAVAFTLVVLSLEALQGPTWIAFVAGIAFKGVFDIFAGWLREWQEAERTVQEVSPDA